MPRDRYTHKVILVQGLYLFATNLDHSSSVWLCRAYINFLWYVPLSANPLSVHRNPRVKVVQKFSAKSSPGVFGWTEWALAFNAYVYSNSKAETSKVYSLKTNRFLFSLSLSLTHTNTRYPSLYLSILFSSARWYVKIKVVKGASENFTNFRI